MAVSKLKQIEQAAEVYGQRSFDNYAQIRSVAEKIRNGFCAWLDNEEQCVFLVPTQGPFLPQNYRSAAFSVSGKGFLPLEPISFGLAVKVSSHGDYMRLILTCRKEGSHMFVALENNKTFEIDLPVKDEELVEVYEGLFGHLIEWFSGRVEQYDHGNYGMTDIGFDIQRIEE